MSFQAESSCTGSSFSFLFFFFLMVFWAKGSLCSLGWSVAHYVDQTDSQRSACLCNMSSRLTWRRLAAEFTPSERLIFHQIGKCLQAVFSSGTVPFHGVQLFSCLQFEVISRSLWRLVHPSLSCLTLPNAFHTQRTVQITERSWLEGPRQRAEKNRRL